MLFAVRSHLQSSQVLRDGVKSYCVLGSGSIGGDELLSWCLWRPFVEWLHTFFSEKVRRSTRYYSPRWRTWTAVPIQLAWWRHSHRLTLASLSFMIPQRPAQLNEIRPVYLHRTKMQSTPFIIRCTRFTCKSIGRQLYRERK
ncbi:hypothetical protein Cni_G21071 [Canna indica]|uniref:Uncharacterized protein n=1 Tax=Canna indica TaxID=4628 RepID=A0AAQ3KQ88_9LILI|nr:hypothetical protein Cni_G21071 [Canna indica]